MKTIPAPTEDGQPTFEILYICLGALKEAMVDGCRRLICMDACFLKGAFGGQLFVAAGIDANNQSFPFAYVVVENETKESWAWFLQLVIENLGINNTSAWTFMSDKQKGLVPALYEVMPEVEIRFCVRHLYTNFRDSHKGIELRKLLWEAARATTIPEFKIAMDKLKSTDVEAYKWLAEKPAMQWSRSHFSTSNNCDILVNNLVEGFNKDIRKAREKLVVTMLKGVMCYLMSRMTKRREKITQWTHSIYPNILNKIETYKKYSASCRALWCGEGHFEIYGPPPEQYTVNLVEHTCSCRRWDLKGIPCSHAIAAISFKHEDVLDYVQSCYKKEINARIYRGIIYPINGWTMWPDSGCVPVLPPIYGRPAGRPMKNIRKKKGELEGSDAEKLKREGSSVKCGNCGAWGHNKRSYSNPTNPDIRRRPSGGYVFSKPTGKPRGRPKQGSGGVTQGKGSGGVIQGKQVSSQARGRVGIPTQGSQASTQGRGRGKGKTSGSVGRGNGNGTGPASSSQPPSVPTFNATRGGRKVGTRGVGMPNWSQH